MVLSSSYSSERGNGAPISFQSKLNGEATFLISIILFVFLVYISVSVLERLLAFVDSSIKRYLHIVSNPYFGIET